MTATPALNRLTSTGKHTPQPRRLTHTKNTVDPSTDDYTALFISMQKRFMREGYSVAVAQMAADLSGMR